MKFRSQLLFKPLYYLSRGWSPDWCSDKHKNIVIASDEGAKQSLVRPMKSEIASSAKLDLSIT
ncbi:MAG: hypothetical protein K8T10_20670 [Candidatus Eremiobacteraeota bacterium]|nr:hypothetical protein [Candidatus Eremiobacteraeota bacterium]